MIFKKEPSSPALSKLISAISAGFIAITVNTLILKVAPLLHVHAESGGLLKLLLIGSHNFIGTNTVFNPVLFSLLFHYLTGFIMVSIYVCFWSPFLYLKGWIKGSLFSLFPWLVNGLIVVPVLGQGWFGNLNLSIAGMIYFFIANCAFGTILGWLYEKFLLMKAD